MLCNQGSFHSKPMYKCYNNTLYIGPSHSWMVLKKPERPEKTWKDLKDISLSKLWMIVKDRNAWCAAVRVVTKSWSGLGNWMTTMQKTTPTLNSSKRDQWSGSLSPIEYDRKLKTNLGQRLIHREWMLKIWGKNKCERQKICNVWFFFWYTFRKDEKDKLFWDSMFKIIKQNKEGSYYHIIQDTDSL